mmetsp:Transcript_12897/g.37162  ORF Transcript_12897/g.37162 Transcript_12897/m.37162 type:complete len:144 (+) Transcript_12897:369-800(+)
MAARNACQRMSPLLQDFLISFFFQTQSLHRKTQLIIQDFPSLFHLSHTHQSSHNGSRFVWLHRRSLVDTTSFNRARGGLNFAGVECGNCQPTEKTATVSKPPMFVTMVYQEGSNGCQIMHIMKILCTLDCTYNIVNWHIFLKM